MQQAVWRLDCLHAREGWGGRQPRQLHLMMDFVQCTCQGCAKDIMAAGAICPMCRTNIKSTITARF